MTEKHNPIVQALLDRGESVEYALDALEVMVNAVVYDEEDPDEVLFDQGLEPDYIMDLIDACERRKDDSK